MNSFGHFNEYQRRVRFERIDSALKAAGRSLIVLVIVGLVVAAICQGVMA